MGSCALICWDVMRSHLHFLLLRDAAGRADRDGDASAAHA